MSLVGGLDKSLLSSAVLPIFLTDSFTGGAGMFNRAVMLILLLYPIWHGDLRAEASSLSGEEQQQQAVDVGDGAVPPSVIMMKEPPAVMAEGSNKCEIVSCGMGLKDTCEISCPADKTPKCSCDCIRNIGPLCMEYKANCRCE
jgi:hypothetical protein